MIREFNIDTSNFIYEKNYLSPNYKEKRENLFRKEYDTSFFTLASKYIYIGTFQNLKYFEKYRNDLLKIFTLKKSLAPKNTEMLNKIKSYKNLVSIHIPYGDYVNKPFQIDDEYYLKAIKYLRNMEDVHYFVLSNDLKLVSKKILISEKNLY